jgi:ribA/ribD-fused uncharacterized protein
MTITSFYGPHFFLSNFFPSVMTATFNNVSYEFPTGEHLFQGAKIFASTWSEDKQQEWLMKLVSNPDPKKAKYHGRSIQINTNTWNSMNINVMRRTQEIKYQNPELAQQLLITGNQELIEGNTWGDKFWGQVNGVGENHLGKLLMERRQKLASLV